MKLRALGTAGVCAVLAVGCAWVTYRLPNGRGAGGMVSMPELVMGLLSVAFTVAFCVALVELVGALLKGKGNDGRD